MILARRLEKVLTSAKGRVGEMRGVLALLAVGSLILSACGLAPNTPTQGAYQLSGSERDVEYPLAWETVVTQCPAMSGYKVVELFATKGRLPVSGNWQA